MNDKIKGLVEQAILDVDIVYEDNILNEELAKMYIPHCFAERFAELIVRECSRVIMNGGYRNPALGEKHSLTPPEIATMIQEHFGVEE